MLEMKCQTALPRLVEQSFSGHLCLKRFSAKCVTYSGTAWKFQQAQRSSAALGRRVQVVPHEKHFRLTSFQTNFNTLQSKTSLWHKDSWDTTV